MLFLQMYTLLLSIIFPIIASAFIISGRASHAEEIRQTLLVPQNHRISA